MRTSTPLAATAIAIAILATPHVARSLPPRYQLTPEQRSAIRLHFSALNRSLRDDRLSPKLRAVIAQQKQKLVKELREVTAGRSRLEFGNGGKSLFILKGTSKFSRAAVIDNRVRGGGGAGPQNATFSRIYADWSDIDIRERADGRTAVRHKQLHRRGGQSSRNLFLQETATTGSTRGQETREEFDSGPHAGGQSLTTRYRVRSGKRTNVRDVARAGYVLSETWVGQARAE